MHKGTLPLIDVALDASSNKTLSLRLEMASFARFALIKLTDTSTGTFGFWTHPLVRALSLRLEMASFARFALLKLTATPNEEEEGEERRGARITRNETKTKNTGKRRRRRR